MSNQILEDSDRQKEDESDDSIFYLSPRFVYHLDESFRKRLEKLYLSEIPSSSKVLDLMSSWTSHLPITHKYQLIVGHGLNEDELKANSSLDRYWIQDLNINQNINIPDKSFDVILITAGWQYLQYPENLAQELSRITNKGGKAIISFSNRAFWNKSPRIWVQSSPNQQLNYVKRVMLLNGWSDFKIISEKTYNKGFAAIFSPLGDPFYSIICYK